MLYVKDNYNSFFLRSILIKVAWSRTWVFYYDHLYILFDSHLMRCLYLFLVCGVVLLILELSCSSKSRGAVLLNHRRPTRLAGLGSSPSLDLRPVVEGLWRPQDSNLHLCHWNFALNRYYGLACLFYPLKNCRNNLNLSSEYLNTFANLCLFLRNTFANLCLFLRNTFANLCLFSCEILLQIFAFLLWTKTLLSPKCISQSGFFYFFSNYPQQPVKVRLRHPRRQFPGFTQAL